jgi:hypothetical protein
MARLPPFSERIGAVSSRTEFQVDSTSRELRNRLMNLVWMDSPPLNSDWTLTRRGFALWGSFFHEYIADADGAQLKIKLGQLCKRDPWYRIYDLIEFVANAAESDEVGRGLAFTKLCNTVLEQELSGFRFIEWTLTRVTSELEVAAVEAGLAHRLPAAREHLRKALEHLGGRPDAQTEATIHEALKAVEAQARDLAGMPSATLGAALKALKAKHQWHTATLEAFEKQYGWASDDGGVRHAFKGEAPDLAIAKYMLISCSAFVNYLEELRGK